MARSQYIYVVFEATHVVGTFTVKHEMESYVERYRVQYPAGVIHCLRYRDNQPDVRPVNVELD